MEQWSEATEMTEEEFAEQQRIDRRKREILQLMKYAFEFGARLNAQDSYLYGKNLRVQEKYPDFEDKFELLMEGISEEVRFYDGSEIIEISESDAIKTLEAKMDDLFNIPENCRDGNHNYSFNHYCGVDVCTGCDQHKGLARCYCGYGISNGDRLEYW